MITREINTTEEFNELLNIRDGKLVVVDFYATWCGPCKVLAPTLDKLTNQYIDNDIVEIVKIDAQKQEVSDLVNLYNIRSVPTLLFIKNSKVVDTKVGNVNIKTIEDLIENYGN